MTSNDGSARPGGRSITQLVGVAKDGLELIRQEIRLARQETLEKATPAARSIGMIFAGGSLAAVGSIYLLQAVVRALATRMPHWLASLLSGGVFTAGGMWLMQRGRSELRNVSIVPEKTINSLREDKEWLLHQIKSRLI